MDPCISLFEYSPYYSDYLCMCLSAHTVSPFRTLLQKFHRLDGYRDLFLTVLENWQIQDQGATRVRVWWGPTSWFVDGLLVTASSLAKEARSSLGSLSLKKNFFFFTFFFIFVGSWLQHIGIFAVSRGLFWCSPCRLSCLEACGILVPLPGIEPACPALQGGFSTTGPPGQSSHEVEPSWPNHRMQTLSHWGLGFNTGTEGDTNIQFTALFAYLFNVSKVKWQSEKMSIIREVGLLATSVLVLWCRALDM